MFIMRAFIEPAADSRGGRSHGRSQARGYGRPALEGVA